jgi:hypothetical protein
LAKPEEDGAGTAGEAVKGVDLKASVGEFEVEAVGSPAPKVVGATVIREGAVGGEDEATAGFEYAEAFGEIN